MKNMASVYDKENKEKKVKYNIPEGYLRVDTIENRMRKIRRRR